MKVALAQLNYTIGDFEGNYLKMREVIEKAESENLDFLIFSELSICGYSPMDLLYDHSFINKSIATIHKLANHCLNVSVLIGAPSIPIHTKGKQLFNSVWLLQSGEAKPVAHKTLLPSSGMKNEYRYFQPNTEFAVTNIKGKRVAVIIGEDLWHDAKSNDLSRQNQLNSLSPIQKLAALKPHFIVHLDAQSFAHDEILKNRAFICNKAAQYKLPIYSVNQTGANTQLVYAGGSMVVSPDGNIVCQLKCFEEDFRIFNFNSNSFDSESVVDNEIELIYKALVVGVKDYFRKSGFKKALIGLSGGLDSAVVAAIAAAALGADNVHGILMPSQYSTDHSVADAVNLAEKLGISYDIIPIKQLFEQFTSSLNNVFSQCKTDVTEENIQARIRGTLLMAYSNKFGHLLLNTSNKSELAVGYGTLYGDMNGGMSVIGDLYKTKTFALAHYINISEEIIPVHTILKPPSAELSPGQMDSDSLPDYELLDHILFSLIEKKITPDLIILKGADASQVKRVVRMVNQNEYKRFQAAPIIQISSNPLGAHRQIPLSYSKNY